MTRIGLLLGKPPARSPVLPDVLVELARHAAVEVHVPADADDLPTWLADVDLVALRGLERPILHRLAGPAGHGVRFCDPPRAVLATRDRAEPHRRLTAVGLRVPGHRVVATWAEVLDRAGAAPVVVKHAAGDLGRGSRVLADGPLPAQAPFDGPYLVEHRIASTRPERKLYHLGARVAAVTLEADGTIDEIDHLDAELTSLAHLAAAACGLTLCGIDVLTDRDGPVVVDVNAFPSARRITGAGRAIAEHLLARARRTPPFATTRGAAATPTGGSSVPALTEVAS